MKDNAKKKHRFFGIPLVFSYLFRQKKFVVAMVTCGLISSGVDVLLPMWQTKRSTRWRFS